MIVRPYGDTAVLVETSADAVLPLCGAVAGAPGVVDVVPAATTLLVEFDPRRTTIAALTTIIETTGEQPAMQTAITGELVTIEVTYDGPDLASVAAEVGLSVEEVVRRHAAGRYTVAFCGFSPGFAYLRGLDPILHVPRLAQPRTSVPEGAVAVAGEFAGVYPRASPGGWRLLGTTRVLTWDIDRDPPTLLAPGTGVRFVTAGAA